VAARGVTRSVRALASWLLCSHFSHDIAPWLRRNAPDKTARSARTRDNRRAIADTRVGAARILSLAGVAVSLASLLALVALTGVCHAYYAVAQLA